MSGFSGATSPGLTKSDVVNNLVNSDATKVASQNEVYNLNIAKANQSSAFTKNSLAAIEAELTSIFNALSEGEFSIFWMQANYSGSMTNGGWSCCSLYKRNSTNGRFIVMGTSRLGVYDGSSWTWS